MNGICGKYYAPCLKNAINFLVAYVNAGLLPLK
jgi:hypothetical protein